MKREEAIEVIRKNYPHVGFSGSEFETALEILIPELNESEDERIRKCIGMALTDVNEQRFIDYGVTLKDCLAYLEKQKERKPAEWAELQSEFKSINEAFEDGKKEVVDNPERYDLCKPAEWSKEDDMLMDELESYILYDKEFNDEQKSWRIKRLKSLRPSWKPSEEQMEALNEIINTLAVSKYPHESDHLFNMLNGLQKNLKKL